MAATTLSTTSTPTDTAVMTTPVKGDVSVISTTPTVTSEDFSLDITSPPPSDGSPFKRLFTCCLPSSEQHREEEEEVLQQPHVMDNVDEMVKTRSLPVKEEQEEATGEVANASSDGEHATDEKEVDSPADKRNLMLGFAVVTGVVATALVNFS